MRMGQNVGRQQQHDAEAVTTGSRQQRRNWRNKGNHGVRMGRAVWTDRAREARSPPGLQECDLSACAWEEGWQTANTMRAPDNWLQRPVCRGVRFDPPGSGLLKRLGSPMVHPAYVCFRFRAFMAWELVSALRFFGHGSGFVLRREPL